MGSDIHAYVEKRRNIEYDWRLCATCFDWRNYDLFGFLADVRNYCEVPPICKPRGFPEYDVACDVKLLHDDEPGHNASWFTLKELLEYDYDKVFWDRRVTKQIQPGVFNGAAQAEEGEGRNITIRELLGNKYFKELERIKMFCDCDPENIRIVFWFDN